MPACSPTKWHRAHTTWFFETFVLAPLGVAPVDPRFGLLFNSYYEAVGDRVARPLRGLLTRPTSEEVGAYRRAIDAAVARELRECPDEVFAKLAPIVELGLHHEEQHQELILTDVLHAFWDSLFNGKTNSHIDILERADILKANPALWTTGRSVIAVTDPLAWLKEGRAIAATSVYSPELLDRIAKGRAEVVEKKSRSLGTRLEHTVMASMPTLALNAYVAKARTIADQQAVTAGLRLAASLKRLHTRATAAP
jgi:hypothetical protein